MFFHILRDIQKKRDSSLQPALDSAGLRLE
jgi:hypothetical protein